MKKTMIFAFGLIAFLVMAGTIFSSMRHINSPQEHTSKEQGSEKIQIVTTLFPLYDFAKIVGGDFVDVTLLLPPGVEAHAFEPTPHDMLTINNADALIYTGDFMEPWIEDIKKGAGANVLIVDTSVGIALMEERDHDEIKDDTHTEEDPSFDNHNIENEHHHGTIDPHIWLDFDHAQIMIDTITNALIQKDPAHAQDYRKHASDYKDRLHALDAKYAASLAACDSRTIVYGGHYAFGYLGKKYDLAYEAAYGISPDAEPSAQDLAQLITQVRTRNISTIFYEELLNDRVARTIAHETGTQLLSLHPAHNISKGQYTDGTSFISLMEKNLQNLTQGLSCKYND